MSSDSPPPRVCPAAPGVAVVRALAPVVPFSRRAEWRFEWEAELTHRWHSLERAGAASPVSRGALLLRALGALPDALWLRRRYGGDPMIRQDLRYALRVLARRPGFTVIVVTTLALCIGATTAIFSVVNAVLLRPLPYAAPDRLVMVWSRDSIGGVERNVVSAANYFDWRRESRSFEQLAAYFPNWNATLTGTEAAERLELAATSSNLFTALGARAAIGRTFLPEEEAPGAPLVAVLGHELWERRFGADPAVLGTSITLDGQQYTVVGVMPPGFKLPGSQAELFTPLPILGRMLEGRIPHLLMVVGRLRNGVTIESAQGEMTTIARRLEREFPESNTGWGITMLALHEQVAGETRRPLLVLLVAVGAVLLIGCANIANLMLARAAGRQREMAVRAALGAGRRRLIIQLLTESLVVAGAAGVIGLALSYVGARALAAIAPTELPRLNDIDVDANVLAFTLGLSLLTAILFGLAPALQAARQAGEEALKDGARATASGGRRRLRNVLVVAEIAFAVVLLVGAGLLISSFVRLRRLDPGFRPENVVAMKVGLPRSMYPEPLRRVAFFDEFTARLRALPSVRAAGAITRLPLHDTRLTTRIVLPGREALAAAEQPEVGLRHVSDGYFAAMGIPVVAGRPITDRDVADSTAPPVVVVNQTLARRFLSGANPVGVRVRIAGSAPTAPPLTIVGVVADVRDGSLREEPEPQIYLSYRQTAPTTLTFILRTTGDPLPLVAAARREVAAMDPNLPLHDVTTLSRVLSEAVTQERFVMLLLGSFAAVAILLAAVGVYGVMAYAVTERTREIGIRLAFGAQHRHVMSLVLGEGLALSTLAVTLGLAAAWASTRAMATLLYGVTAVDGPTYSSVGVLLLLVALFACYLPARRAARMDPMCAMRSED
ncbi:MAG TPA: ABC transporter permease [Gemmatimonadaceae bacterium]|nr:ABC transporter permease [Gemmatimonadaceae bacterium]